MPFSPRNNFLIAGKQMLMEFNGAREIVRREQAMRYRGTPEAGALCGNFVRRDMRGNRGNSGLYRDSRKEESITKGARIDLAL